MRMLKELHLAGWKSIQDQKIELRPLNVLIGGNGSGKSNLVSFFRLLNAMVGKTPGLREFVGRSGGANAILHFGSRQTPVAEMGILFETETGTSGYHARWAHAAGDTLIFTEERVEFQRPDRAEPQVFELGAGHSETRLIERAESRDKTAEVVLQLLRGCRLFHFHDTSEGSAIRGPCYIEENRFLYPDGRNLAAMLYLYQQQHPEVYHRIRSTVRQAIPSFDDFSLEPRRLDPRSIVLNWRQRGSDYEFGPHQLSDGSLRFIALTSLLSQPESSRPRLVALDEPELGLHPAALEILAGMAKAASLDYQVLIATQSPVLLDFFDPSDVVVVKSAEGRSQFHRLSETELDAWLDEFTLSEIWEKNVVGGGPYE